jgi:FG-GAP repeat
VAADFNNDRVADLAIGVPGEAVGGPENEIAGAVNVLYGAGGG